MNLSITYWGKDDCDTNFLNTPRSYRFDRHYSYHIRHLPCFSGVRPYVYNQWRIQGNAPDAIHLTERTSLRELRRIMFMFLHLKE